MRKEGTVGTVRKEGTVRIEWTVGTSGAEGTLSSLSCQGRGLSRSLCWVQPQASQSGQRGADLCVGDTEVTPVLASWLPWHFRGSGCHLQPPGSRPQPGRRNDIIDRCFLFPFIFLV